MTDIDGPRLGPSGGGAAKGLVVFLHGYGADGNDLIGIGQVWAPLLPETAFVSPHGPAPCDEAPMGRQWFPLSGMDPHRLREGVLAAAPVVDRFIDAEMERTGVAASKVVLVGFSQGTMLALHVGPRRKEPLAGIVGYSGLLPGPEHMAEIVSRPPVQLVHGADDPLVPSLATQAAAEMLKRDGFEVSAHIRPGLQHGIDEEGLRLGADFVARVLGDET